MTRFKPTRAGVINVWDYIDEEWAFADGRLALRGHNGSGKTKALEVLFPFVLDGVADSRRLDPFSGENRTMKSNLLYRGQESEYGYVWMEFARKAPASRPNPETITLIIGMRAHRNTDGVRMSFYVTGKRLGADFGLLSADSRPLTERQLRAVLEPDAWRRTATEYRDLVDRFLFGLGRERYAQLLDLLLALRRPLLAKDLDPGKVSDTLTSGLSPVDEDLVQQAARDFENLAAVQKLFDDLTAANAAVREFRAHYEAYLRAHVRFALERGPAAGRLGRRARGADHRGDRGAARGGRGRTRGRGRAERPPRRRRAAPGPAGRPEELRGVQGPGPHRGQAPRGGAAGAGGRGPAPPAGPGPPPHQGPGGRGGQAQPPRRAGAGRSGAAERRAGRRRAAVRHRRRRLRPRRSVAKRGRRRPDADGTGPRRGPPRRRGRDPQALGVDPRREGQARPRRNGPGPQGRRAATPAAGKRSRRRPPDSITRGCRRRPGGLDRPLEPRRNLRRPTSPIRPDHPRRR